MKKTISYVLAVLMILLFTIPACASSDNVAATSDSTETVITLSDGGIQVNGSAAPTDSSAPVYVGADIVYYEAGHDSSYGKGTIGDEHTAGEAKAHTVVTITKAGTYRISGTLSAGQLAVDLGEKAASDPTAVVTLILDGVNITCTVAPAVIFYNVYECGTTDVATGSSIADTSKAGANVIIADGSVNNVNGSYVARIYQEGTTKKLHKYDGAFYSKMSMNVSGQTLGSGVLNIAAENEGLDSELHLTVNGGNINITAQNDGINTNEDGVSVTTINGGTLYINAGFGAEGDGIDSNGYLVINSGTVIAPANPQTGDSSIDADMDILINGGTVIALGSRNGAVNIDSHQAYMGFSYATTQKAGTLIRIEDANGEEVLSFAPASDYQSVTVSSPSLNLDATYHLYAGGELSGAATSNSLYEVAGTYSGGIQQQYSGTGMMRGPGSGMRGGMMPPEGTGPGWWLSLGPSDGSGRTDGAAMAPADGSERRVRPDGAIPPEGLEKNRAQGNMANQQGASGGSEAIASILPTEDGSYQLTISVLSGNASYTGTNQWMFNIGG